MTTNQYLISGTADDPATDGTSEFSCLLGDGSQAWTATENQRESVISTPGKLSNFKVGVKTAPGVGNSWVFTIRKNTGDTALSVTISDSSVLSSLDTDEVVVAAGDRVSIKAVGVSVPTAAGAVYWYCQFTPDTDGETILLSNSYGTITGTYFHNLIGTQEGQYESDAQILFPTPGRLKRFYVDLVTAPGGITSRTFTIRKNGNPQSLAVTISGANTTGNDTDPAHDVDIAAGDLVAIGDAVSGSPAATAGHFGIVFLPDTQGEYIASANPFDKTSSTAIEYLHMNCGNGFLTGTENEQHGLCPATTAKKIYVKLDTSPGSGNSWIFTLRDDLASTALTVTLTNAQTGNASVDVAIVEASLLDTYIDARAGTATSYVKVAYLFYNAPIVAAVPRPGFVNFQDPGIV